MAPRRRQRDGDAVAVAALDAQPVPPPRRLAHLHRGAVPRLHDVAAHRKPIRTQADQLVEDAGLHLAVERRILDELLDDLDAALADLDVDLDLRRQHRQSLPRVAGEGRDPFGDAAEEIGLPQLSFEGIADHLLHTHASRLSHLRKIGGVLDDESIPARREGAY